MLKICSMVTWRRGVRRKYRRRCHRRWSCWSRRRRSIRGRQRSVLVGSRVNISCSAYMSCSQQDSSSCEASTSICSCKHRKYVELETMISEGRLTTSSSMIPSTMENTVTHRFLPSVRSRWYLSDHNTSKSKTWTDAPDASLSFSNSNLVSTCNHIGRSKESPLKATGYCIRLAVLCKKTVAVLYKKTVIVRIRNMLEPIPVKDLTWSSHWSSSFFFRSRNQERQGRWRWWRIEHQNRWQQHSRQSYLGHTIPEESFILLIKI